MVGLAIILVAVAAALASAVMFWKRGARRVGTPPQRATYEALHTASLAVSALRDGLTASSAVRAAPALRQ
jgi:two-component system LytT family sensor kinase